MYDFTQNLSTRSRKLIYGIGINDAPYITQPHVNNKQICCPFYSLWQSMLKRCYSHKYQLTKPTYIGCTVCTEWLSFMNFRAWILTQAWEGNHLDKDIKIKGNKVYAPHLCMYVPAALNTIIKTSRLGTGKYPLGVRYFALNNKYASTISIAGKSIHLGCFDTIEEASDAYWEARKIRIQNLIDNNTYPMATPYLAQHI